MTQDLMTQDLDEKVNAFFAYWQSLPRDMGTIMPPVQSFLDHADPAMQPHVALVDVNSEQDWTLRLYGTGRVNSFGRDLSGINPIEVYAEEIRPLLIGCVMTTLRHPCGWRSTRRVLTINGMTNYGAGVTLPLATDAGQPQCICNFMVFAKPIAHNDRQGQVEDIPWWEWIDIGAGVPES